MPSDYHQYTDTLVLSTGTELNRLHEFVRGHTHPIFIVKSDGELLLQVVPISYPEVGDIHDFDGFIEEWNTFMSSSQLRPRITNALLSETQLRKDVCKIPGILDHGQKKNFNVFLYVEHDGSPFCKLTRKFHFRAPAQQ